MFNIGDLLTYRHNKAVWILLGTHETVRGIKYILTSMCEILPLLKWRVVH